MWPFLLKRGALHNGFFILEKCLVLIAFSIVSKALFRKPHCRLISKSRWWISLNISMFSCSEKKGMGMPFYKWRINMSTIHWKLFKTWLYRLPSLPPKSFVCQGKQPTDILTILKHHCQSKIRIIKKLNHKLRTFPVWKEFKIKTNFSKFKFLCLRVLLIFVL